MDIIERCRIYLNQNDNFMIDLEEEGFVFEFIDDSYHKVVSKPFLGEVKIWEYLDMCDFELSKKDDIYYLHIHSYED